MRNTHGSPADGNCRSIKLHFDWPNCCGPAITHCFHATLPKLDLGLHCAAATRAADKVKWLNGAANPEHRPNPSQRPGEPGIYLYSALYDRHTKEITVFAEVDGAVTDAAFQSCIATSADQAATVELPAKFEMFMVQDEGAFLWRPLKLVCSGAPEWVTGNSSLALKVQDSSTLHQSPKVPVEVIEAELVSEIGACAGPLFSAVPTMHDWLFYYWTAGVKEFYFYVPHGNFIDTENYTRVQGSFPAHGYRSKQQTATFYSSVVTWMHYYPVHQSHYFGQMVVHNDCVARNRYKHHFLVMLDVDEFIAIENGAGTLQEFLQRELPENVAGLQLPISWHTVSCPSGQGGHRYEGYDVFADRTPDKAYFSKTDKSSWYGGSKSVIRPLNVLTQHVHLPLAVKPGVEGTREVLPSIASMKHVRCGSWQ